MDVGFRGLRLRYADASVLVPRAFEVALPEKLVIWLLSMVLISMSMYRVASMMLFRFDVVMGHWGSDDSRRLLRVVRIGNQEGSRFLGF